MCEASSLHDMTFYGLMKNWWYHFSCSCFWEMVMQECPCVFGSDLKVNLIYRIFNTCYGSDFETQDIRAVAAGNTVRFPGDSPFLARHFCDMESSFQGFNIFGWSQPSKSIFFRKPSPIKEWDLFAHESSSALSEWRWNRRDFWFANSEVRMVYDCSLSH
jgi:hypothetical protein